MCSACQKSRNGDFEGLEELLAKEPSYMCRCSQCGALWWGDGRQPQIMVELTAEQAEKEFPGFDGKA